MLFSAAAQKAAAFFLCRMEAREKRLRRSERTPALHEQPLPAGVGDVAEALNKGELTRAMALACAALQRGEVTPLLLNLRASRYEQEGNGKAALADLLRAHELDPADATVSNALGVLLMKHGQFFEAIKAYDAALRAAPEFAAAQFNKGFACEAAGYMDQATKSYRAAVALDANSAEPFARLASLAVRRGDIEEAARSAREALSLRPDHVAALQSLVSVDISRGRPAEAGLAIQTLLERPALSDYERYLTMGLLGELHEAQGRFAEAYRAFCKGNQDYYQANRPRFGVGGTVSTSLAWLTAFYGSCAKIAAHDQHRGRAAHAFLVGFPRSGTTLLEQALASHPAVVTMEEKDAFSESVRAFMAGPETHARLAKAGDGVLNGYRDAYWRNVRDFGFARTGHLFIDKHPFHTLKLPIIAALFPEAKILFALRDPRDVVLGCLRARFRTNPYTIELLRPLDAAEFYSAYMNLAGLYRKALPVNVHEVRHEEMVTDFDGTCRKVCSYLGIEWSPSMRDFASHRKVRAIATPSARQIAGGLSGAGIGRWRHYADELAPLMPTLMPWVDRFGYTQQPKQAVLRAGGCNE